MSQINRITITVRTKPNMLGGDPIETIEIQCSQHMSVAELCITLARASQMAIEEFCKKSKPNL